MTRLSETGKRMSHAATDQTPVAPESATPQNSGQEKRPAGPVSDLALAGAAARAARTVSGVVDLSPGHGTPAATYGSGQRVTGVVVHHLALEEVVLEIH